MWTLVLFLFLHTTVVITHLGNYYSRHACERAAKKALHEEKKLGKGISDQYVCVYET